MDSTPPKIAKTGGAASPQTEAALTREETNRKYRERLRLLSLQFAEEYKNEVDFLFNATLTQEEDQLSVIKSISAMIQRASIERCTPHYSEKKVFFDFIDKLKETSNIMTFLNAICCVDKSMSFYQTPPYFFAGGLLFLQKMQPEATQPAFISSLISKHRVAIAKKLARYNGTPDRAFTIELESGSDFVSLCQIIHLLHSHEITTPNGFQSSLLYAACATFPMDRTTAEEFASLFKLLPKNIRVSSSLLNQIALNSQERPDFQAMMFKVLELCSFEPVIIYRLMRSSKPLAYNECIRQHFIDQCIASKVNAAPFEISDIGLYSCTSKQFKNTPFLLSLFVYCTKIKNDFKSIKALLRSITSIYSEMPASSHWWNKPVFCYSHQEEITTDEQKISLDYLNDDPNFITKIEEMTKINSFDPFETIIFFGVFIAKNLSKEKYNKANAQKMFNLLQKASNGSPEYTGILHLVESLLPDISKYRSRRDMVLYRRKTRF